jgi:predicted HAD superfamily Cof-like phosphohydrolase
MQTNTNTWFDDVLKFVRKSGRHISAGPNPQFPDLELRQRLINEEYHELLDAVEQQNLPDTADAIVDLMYVLMGAAASWGLDIREVWKEVQDANMRKFDHPDGPRIVNEKIVKPEGWVGPDVEGALKRGLVEAKPHDPTKFPHRGPAGFYSELQVLHSAAGYFIGRTFWDSEDGFEDMGSRESDYYPAHEAAAADLAAQKFEVRSCPENELAYSEGLPRPSEEG